ncbi:hypothetical protein [Cyanobium sp. ATX 6F1]|uniref:hypothetical protein n=1 Tax=unclassified Cyanobium TaxID=2627006 RepID=UPI0020CCC0C4|nr:hypothetical protein [Cyanobium sp. ATX 6F1]MCP9916131.1 hypothetical protein [Cyanobium sp. ATX 6F1]
MLEAWLHEREQHRGRHRQALKKALEKSKESDRTIVPSSRMASIENIRQSMHQADDMVLGLTLTLKAFVYSLVSRHRKALTVC